MFCLHRWQQINVTILPVTLIAKTLIGDLCRSPVCLGEWEINTEFFEWICHYWRKLQIDNDGYEAQQKVDGYFIWCRDMSSSTSEALAVEKNSKWGLLFLTLDQDKQKISWDVHSLHLRLAKVDLVPGMNKHVNRRYERPPNEMIYWYETQLLLKSSSL